MTSHVLQIGEQQSYRAVSRACADAGLANPLTSCRDLGEAHRLLGLRPGVRPGQPLPRPAVIVTDLRLADGSGLDLLREVRAQLGLRRTPVVVVGADASDAEIGEVYRWGQAAYLSAAMIAFTLLDVVREMRLPWSLEAYEPVVPVSPVNPVGAAS